MKRFFFGLLIISPLAFGVENNCCTLDSPALDSASFAGQFEHSLDNNPNLLQEIRPTEHHVLPVEILADYNSNEKSLSSNKNDKKVTVDEVNLGVRKQWDIFNISPYIGGGIAVAGVTSENAPKNPDQFSDEKAYNLGNYYQAGADIHINENLSFGIHLEYSNTKLEFAGENIKGPELSTGISTLFRW